MILTKPFYIIRTDIDGIEMLESIERAGRTCYRSEDKITRDSCVEFAKMILKKGHETVLEHEFISVRFICDRGVSHELVRHRLASFSQESTRYVNYNKRGMEFIIPSWCGLLEQEYDECDISALLDSNDPTDGIWLESLRQAECAYNELIKMGWKPEQARSVLPNSLKTEIVVTANIREWRHILKLRTSTAAHPDIRNLMRPLLKDFKILIPILFDDITYLGEN